MEPYKVKRNGRWLGNAAEAGRICGIRWETYQWYVRTGRPAGNPPPAHVATDDLSGQRLYPLKDVAAWLKSRRGRGNWGGIGARARHRDDTPDVAADDPEADRFAEQDADEEAVVDELYARNGAAVDETHTELSA